MRAMEENHVEEIREGNWYEEDEEGPSRGYSVNGHDCYAQYLAFTLEYMALLGNIYRGYCV